MKVDILSVNNEKNLSSLELFQVIKNKITVKNLINNNNKKIYALSYNKQNSFQLKKLNNYYN